jgi:NAD(P)-dependent dehydrogenase (short-subunit alcohol dehydrogenase family)
MKLVVLGATGGIGLEIVRQAVEHGHSVTAFVRSPERLKPFQGRITVQQGDALNSAELERAIRVDESLFCRSVPPSRVPVFGLLKSREFLDPENIPVHIIDRGIPLCAGLPHKENRLSCRDRIVEAQLAKLLTEQGGLWVVGF